MGTSAILSSVATLLLRGASFGFRVSCMLVVARKAGPQLFGTITVLFTMAEIARVVADAGVDTTMIQVMATQRGDALARSMGAAISTKLAAGGVVALVLLAIMFVFSPGTPVLNAVVALLSLTPLGLDFGANYFVATRQAGAVALPVSTLTGLAGLAFVVTAWLLPEPTPLLLLVAAYGLVLGATLVRLAFRFARVRPIRTPGAARALFATALPLGVAIAVGYAYGKIDVFVIDHFQGQSAVGQYGFWARLLDPVLFVTGVVAVTACGHLSGPIHERDAARTREIARRYAALNLTVSIGVAALLAVAGRPVAQRYFSSYADSLWLARLLSGLLVLRSMNSILTAILQAAELRRLFMVVSFVNFAVAVLACVSLGSVSGVLGVVAGLIVMETINFAMQSTLVFRVLRAPAPS